jgi:hypothetical protein
MNAKNLLRSLLAALGLIVVTIIAGVSSVRLRPAADFLLLSFLHWPPAHDLISLLLGMVIAVGFYTVLFMALLALFQRVVTNLRR